jgi:hypothetical protein
MAIRPVTFIYSIVSREHFGYAATEIASRVSFHPERPYKGNLRLDAVAA